MEHDPTWPRQAGWVAIPRGTGTFEPSARTAGLCQPSHYQDHPWPPHGWLKIPLSGWMELQALPHLLGLLATPKYSPSARLEDTQPRFMAPTRRGWHHPDQRAPSILLHPNPPPKSHVQQLGRVSSAEASASGRAAALEAFEAPLPSSPHLESRLPKCKKSVVFVRLALNIFKSCSGRKVGSGPPIRASNRPSGRGRDPDPRTVLETSTCAGTGLQVELCFAAGSFPHQSSSVHPNPCVRPSRCCFE